MTKLEFTCSDEKSVFLLKAARLYDEGVKLEPVRHGEWIPSSLDPDDPYFVCSVCGLGYSTIYHEGEAMEYCPSCGAKMDGDMNG